MLGFSVVAALGVHSVVAPRAGEAAALVFAVALFAALLLAARIQARAQPAALAIGPDGIAAYDAAGRMLAHGRIAGSAQWAGRLLVIALAPHEGGRGVPVVLAADSLRREAFRELAVRARQAAS